MLTGSLWPIHFKPYNNELLSSWLVRLAHAHGLKIQSFYHLEFGSQYEIWNRDIDRLAPEWLLNRLCVRTGISAKKVSETTLQSYQNKLFSNYRRAGTLSWLQTLKIYHRTQQAYGLQYCPLCLKEDNEPYFRKSWRCSLYTFCPYHKISMLDCCPQCKSAITFYRQELGKPQNYSFKKLSKCWKCSFDLVNSPTVFIKTIDYKITRKWQKLLIKLDNQRLFSQHYQDKLRILHHLCTIIISTRLAPELSVYLKKKTGIQLNPVLANSIENCDIEIRKVVIFYSFWLLERFPDRIITAWKNKFIKYNHLLKDFDFPPHRYIKAINSLNKRVKNKSIDFISKE